jgi:hypothetical protein
LIIGSLFQINLFLSVSPLSLSSEWYQMWICYFNVLINTDMFNYTEIQQESCNRRQVERCIAVDL